ncbi:MAG: hypothetical protein OXB86_05380 [Bdellovibrionales bacterium]|nr:hypothetical protein [Bdellovibrionales bacterium]
MEKSFYSQYQEIILSQYPETHSLLPKIPWKHIVFPEVIKISSSIFHQMAKVVSAIYSLKSDKEYLDFLKSHLESGVCLPHPQDSVLMAYDFHLDSSGAPRLIEVNTNGAGFLITDAVYQTQGIADKKPLEELIQSFQEEWNKFQQGGKTLSKPSPEKVALMDENPFQQKMILEFLMYKKIFQRLNWSADIYDSKDLKEDSDGFLRDGQGRRVDFVYNRSTDFYLEKSPHLQRAYRQGKACFSPHPSEYFLLSDKARLCDWGFHKGKWPSLKDIVGNLIESQILTENNADWAWENKKKLFFKISQGHGGQSAYRGKTLTRKKFSQLRQGLALFQEYIPPPVFRDSSGQEWKFDLRAYAYQGHIQQIAARCYKGQVTNFQEEGGGFAAVKFV